MLNKVAQSAVEALADVGDGSTVLLAGFGDAGRPDALVEHGLRPLGVRELTIVSNNAGRGTYSLGGLIADGQVRRLICSFPTGGGSDAFRSRLDRGEIEMELVPQGILVERLRAAGSGLLGICTVPAVGTDFYAPERVIKVDGRDAQLHLPLHGDVALLRGAYADPAGNVVCHRAARNFNPVMAMAARHTVVQVDEIRALGSIDPDAIHIPGVLVDAIVCHPREA